MLPFSGASKNRVENGVLYYVQGLLGNMVRSYLLQKTGLNEVSSRVRVGHSNDDGSQKN